MPCTEAYREHIMYTFCKTVIRFAAINAWRDRSRRRQKEISLSYPTEEKFYPLGTADEYFEAPYEEYPVTICGQKVILTMGSLPPPCYLCRREIRNHFPLLFRTLHTTGNRGNVRTLPECDWASNPQDFTASVQKNGGTFIWGIRTFCPMKRLSGRPMENRQACEQSQPVGSALFSKEK